jgi:hypothetical protein
MVVWAANVVNKVSGLQRFDYVTRDTCNVESHGVSNHVIARGKEILRLLNLGARRQFGDVWLLNNSALELIWKVNESRLHLPAGCCIRRRTLMSPL